MSKTFSELLDEQTNDQPEIGATLPDPGVEQPGLFEDVFGENGEKARYIPKEPEKSQPGTFDRLLENIRRGGNGVARNYHFLAAADQTTVLNQYNKAIEEFQSAIDSGEASPSQRWEFNSGPARYAHTMEELKALRDEREQKFSSALTKVAENHIASKNLENHRSEVSDKFFNAESEAEGLWDSVKEMWERSEGDRMGILGDVLAEGGIELGASIGAAVATRGRSLPASMTAQAGVGGVFAKIQEFSDALVAEGGEGIDFSDTKVLRSIFENQEAIAEAHEKSTKAGGVAAGAAALGNFLAVKGILPVETVAGAPIGKALEAGAQGVVQGAIGAGTEVGMAEAADREVNPVSAVVGGAMGVAGAGPEAIMGRSADASKVEATNSKALNKSLDEIYNEADAAPIAANVSREKLDLAEEEFRKAMSDETLPAEALEEARIAAVAARKDYDAEVSKVESEPVETPVSQQIEEAAKSMPDDDPQLKAFREQRDGPKSEFDVPESDPRYSAARDYLDDENLTMRDAARDRFENQETNDEIGQSRNRGEGFDPDRRIEEGRTEGQSVKRGRDGEIQHQERNFEEDVNNLQVLNNEAQPGITPPADRSARTLTKHLDNDPLADQRAASAEIDRLVETSENLEGISSVDDMPDGSLKSQIIATEIRTGGHVRGVFDPKEKKIILFKNRMQNADEVRELAIHEASHAARRPDGGEVPVKIQEDLEKLYDMLGGEEGVVSYAKDRGIDLSPYQQMFANSGDRKAHLMTDELLAMIHGKESGEAKQLARRALRGIETNVKNMTGVELDLFKRTGGRDEIDGEVIRQIAAAEQTLRENRVMSTKHGIMATSKNFSPVDQLPWNNSDWMPNFVHNAVNSVPGLKIRDKWNSYIRTDGGLGDQGQAARVNREASMRDSNVKVHDRTNRLLTEINKIDRKKRVAARKRMNEYLKDRSDIGTDIPIETRNVLDQMRRDIDAGSTQVARKVLAEQLKAKVWKMERKRPDYYRPEGEDPLSVRIETWKNNPEMRIDEDHLEYFQMITPLMREHVDLMETIDSQLGSYLTTSYAAHSEKKYHETVMGDRPKVERFSEMLIEIDRDNSPEARRLEDAREAFEYSEDGADNAKARERLAKAQKEYDDRPDMSIDEARAALSQLLRSAGKLDTNADMINVGSVMGIDRDSFKAKTLNDPRMKEILGEYDDVLTNYAQTMKVVDGIVSNHNMQRAMMKSLDDMGLISPERSRDKLGKDPMETALMANQEMSVLNGYYTTPVIEDSLMSTMNGFRLSENPIVASLVKTSASVNYGKTILSPPTQVMNYASNFFIQAANGHLFHRGSMKMAGESSDLNSRSSEHVFFKDLYKGKADAVEKYRRYTRLGIASETVDINELGDILGNGKSKLRETFDAWVDDPEVTSFEDVMQSYADSKLGGVTDFAKLSVQKASKAKQFAEFTYGAGDDMFKIRAFEAELEIAKKYKGLEGDEADAWAAQRVRDGYLMYSELNRLVRDIKNAPGIGVFVSFPASMIKASKGQVKLAARDLLDDDLPPTLRARRAVGMITAYSASTAIAATSSAIIGMDYEEEQAWRKTLPPWAQQNDILFLGRAENGDPIYIDLSRANPYSYFKIGMRELFKENDDTFLGVNTNLYDMAKSYASPFVSTNILTNALIEMTFDIDIDQSRRHTNPALSNEAQAQSRIMQFATTVAPGFASQGMNLWDAAINDKKWYGSENSFSKAAMKMFGVNIGRMDRDVSFRFFTSSMRREIGNAATLVSRPMGDMSRYANYEDIKEALFDKRRAEVKQYENMIEMIQIVKELGLSDKKVKGMLGSHRIPKRISSALLKGEMPELLVTGREGSQAYGIALIQADTQQEKEEIKAERKRRVAFLHRAQKEWLESLDN